MATGLGIIRTYATSFLLLPFNMLGTYYFQALMQPRIAFVLSIARGCVISGALILLLPAVAGAGALWLAMPITETNVAAPAAFAFVRATRELSAAA